MIQAGGELKPTAVSRPTIVRERQVAESVDDRPLGRPVGQLAIAITEGGPGDRALAAAARPDNQADLPGFVQVGHFGRKLRRGPLGQRHVEHARHLLHAERVVDRAIDLNCNLRHWRT